MIIAFIVFLIASVLLSYFSLGAKEYYRLGHSMRNIGISVLLLTTLTVHSALIYFIATKLIFLTIVLLIAFYIYWFMFAPFYVDSDPAGVGMAEGFHVIICVGSGIVFGIVFYVLNLFLSPMALYIALGIWRRMILLMFHTGIKILDLCQDYCHVQKYMYMR